MNTLTVELVPIESLRPDPANPRRINDEELESLTRSLRQWGFVQPVLARRQDGTVIGGHQRLVAARRLGFAIQHDGTIVALAGPSSGRLKRVARAAAAS